MFDRIAEGRVQRRLLMYVLLAGALARVVYLQQVSDLPFFDDPVGDSARHLERAAEIRAGRWLPDRPFFYGGIPYPWILAGLGALFGRSLYPVCLAQALAGVALAWLLHRLCMAAAPRGRRRQARWAGLIAATLAAFYGPFAFLEADILMVSWTLVALALAAVALLRSRRSTRPAGGGPLDHVRRVRSRAAGGAAFAGVLLAVAAAERPNLVALIPAAALWAAACFPRPARLRAAAALAAAGAITLLPVALINRAVSGEWILLTTSSGINFSIGNHAGARGTFAEPWDTDPHATARDTDLELASLQRARRDSGRELDAAGASRHWWAEGWRWIRAHPGEAARLWGRKAALFWSGQELPNHLHFDFLRQAAPALWLLPLSFAWVAPAGLRGLAGKGRRRSIEPSARSLLALMVGVPMLTVLPFFVADRYRVVVVPFLMAAAGHALADLGRRLLRPETRRRAMAAAGGLLAGTALLSIPLVEVDRSRDHWMLAQAWKKQGDLDRAVRAYEQAVRLSPADAVLRNNLGVALAGMGRLEEAERQYRAAIGLDPALAFPHKNLGLLLAGSGRRREALAHLQRAREAEPEDPEIAAALKALGDAP